MKLFLDTANLEQIKKQLSTGLVDGITTNPTLLSKEGGNPKQIIMDICHALPNGDVSVEVTELSSEAVYKQAHEIAALAKNVVVKVPCVDTYYPVIKQLVTEGIAINITLVFSLAQGHFMSKLGVKYISPFVGRLDDSGADGATLLYELRAMIDQYDYQTQILAASLRTLTHVNAAILAGADVATIPVELFTKAMNHPLSAQGIEKFNADWKKLGITRFP